MKNYIVILIASMFFVGCGGSSEDGIESNQTVDMIELNSDGFKSDLTWGTSECGLLENQSTKEIFGRVRYYQDAELSGGRFLSAQYEDLNQNYWTDTFGLDSIDLTNFQLENFEAPKNEIVIPHTVVIDGETYNAEFQIKGDLERFRFALENNYSGAVFMANYRYVIFFDDETCSVNGLGYTSLISN